MSGIFERLPAPPPVPAGVVPAPVLEALEKQRRAQQVQVWFGLSLALLFVVAELSSPGPLIIVTAINFVLSAAATVVQIARSWARGALVVVKGRVVGWAACLSVLVAGAGFALDAGTRFGRAGSVMLIGGVLVLYLSAGTWILRRRFAIWEQLAGTGARGGTRQLLWVILYLGVALLGCVLLKHGAVTVGVLLLGLGVAMLPGALSILAEYAHHSFRSKGRGIGAALVGLGLIAVGVLIGLRPAGSDGLAVALLIGLAVLIVMVVTATLLDIAVVLLVLALVGVAAPSADPLEDPWPSDQRVLVALGDSYLSGEGARQFIDGTDRAGVNECRRARTAWPVLVSDRAPFDGLAFLACSGARTYNLRPLTRGATSTLGPAPRSQYERSSGTQLDDYRDHFAALVTSPPLVVLSLGGNDAGFASIGTTCLAPGSCNAATPRDLFSKGNLLRLQNRLRQAYTEVRAAFPRSPVVVVPYPNPIDAGNAPCSQAPLEEGDVAFVRTILAKLDTVIEQTRREYGFYFADTLQTALEREHLQLCDPSNHGRAGINFLNAQSVGGVSGDRFNPLSWKHGSLHPNELGHAALARAFDEWLSDQDPAHVRNPAVRGDVSAGLAALRPATDVVRDPAPELVDESAKKLSKDDCADRDKAEACNDLATDWALGQVGRFFLDVPRLLSLLLVAWGAWLIGLVLVRRP